MFYKIKGRSSLTGKGTVSVVYRQTGFETVKATGVAVLAADFDLKTGRVKGRVKEHPEMNARIQEVTTNLELAVQDAKDSGLPLTKAAVDAAYDSILAIEAAYDEVSAEFKQYIAQERVLVTTAAERLTKRKEKLEMIEMHIHGKPSGIAASFHDKITDFIKEDTQHYSKPTKRGFLDLASMLKEWNPTLRLEDVTLKIFNDFQNALKIKALRNSSVRTIMQRFRTVYRNLIVGTGLTAEFLKDFKGLEELANDEVIYLTQEEVTMIAQLPLICKAQKQIRLQFLLGCEVGLRHKDLVRLTPNNITGDTLTIVNHKKKTTVKPPITVKARAILEELELPAKQYHINYYNKVLRKILIKIEHFHQEVTLTHFVNNEPMEETLPKYMLVSSHVARKTAINNWLAKGVRESVVVRWAGHKDAKMIQKYYSNKEAETQQEMIKLL